MKLAIIPARGGSKRIPRKNIINFCGKPMISWSIKAAKECNCFDEIIVSTDDEEIANIAKSYGAKVPFNRPTYLADDHCLTQDVIKNAIEWYENNNKSLEFVCCIYATAPLINSRDIKKATEILKETKVNSFIFPASSFQYPIQRALKINKNGYANMKDPKKFISRSQDLEEHYHDAGQFYLAHTEAWKEVKSIFKNSRPIIIPNWRVQDIDNEEDLKYAEIKARILEMG